MTPYGEAFAAAAAAGGGGSVTNPELWLANAVHLLASGDLIGAKTFAEHALDVDPLIAGADHLLAVADVLLAADRHRFDNQIDWYSVLQLDPSAPSDPAAVLRHFRRLALLLRPDLNQLPFAANAYKIVLDGWSVLSDPAKKSLFDSERRIAFPTDTTPPPQPAAPAPAPAPAPTATPAPVLPKQADFWAACPSCRYVHNYESIYEGQNVPCQSCRRSFHAAALPAFWTACTSCFHVYQYDCVYEGRTLRCQSCRQAFRASSLTAAPPIVPGTDSYFCSWGFFPVGFQSQEGSWKLFFPAPQCRGSAQPQPKASKCRNEESFVAGKRSLGMHKKMVAKERVRLSSRRRFDGSGFGARSGAGSEIRSESIDINKEWESCV